MDACAVQDDLVFDVGAHLGEDSVFYLRLGYRVVAVEANPELAASLRRRFSSEIAAGRYVLVEAAIAAAPGAVTFYRNEKLSVWGTTQSAWAARNELLGTKSSALTVQGVLFVDLLRQYGCPHYLKVDIEGADMLCIDALNGLAERPVYVSVESTKTSWEELLGEFDALESLGYTKFKVVNQLRHRSGTFVARNGSSFWYAFEPASSGPFGENLPGEWLTRAAAVSMYRRVFRLYGLFGDEAALAKVLRPLPLMRGLLRRVGWYDTHACRN